MAETATAPVEGSTVLTAPEKVEVKAEEKLFPKTPTGEEKTTAEKEASDKAATDKAAADKAEAEKKPTQEKTTTETKPPTEEKKPEADKAAAKPQTDYDLVLPKDSPLGADDLAQTLKDAKAAGLTKEQAESLLTSKDQGARALQTRQQQAFEQTKVQWKEAVEKDPEMGGEKFTETIQVASRAFKSLASPELQIWADRTGLGSYPEFVRLMARVGRMMAEDKLVRGTIGETGQPKPPEEILYGKTTPAK